MSHDDGRTCFCVKRHSPSPAELHRHHAWPLSMGGTENGEAVWLCPTSHVDTHELIRRWIEHNGSPPWSVRRYFGRYVQHLAERAFLSWDTGGRP
jgi:hypothetical protein